MIPTFQPNRQQRKKAERLKQQQLRKHPLELTQIDIRAATHEAGHCVCAVAYGFRVYRLSLSAANVSKKLNRGPGGIEAGYDLSRVIPCAAVAYAGFLAESILFPGKRPSFSDGDRDLAMSAIDQLPKHQRAEAEQVAQQLARDTITLNLAAVKELARTLLERKELTGDDIAGLMRRVA